MKLFANPPLTDHLSATHILSQSVAALDNPERSERIATGAYYMAEARGFIPGQELDDWLSAEAVINTSGEKL